MSEVHRYQVVKMLSDAGNKIAYDPHGPWIVMARDFDRVTAERDAALGREADLVERKAELREGITKHWQVVCDQRSKIDALQQRLTAADEALDSTRAELAWQESDNAELRKREDVLEGLLLRTNELLYEIQGDPDSVPSSAIDAMRGEVFTALKPAEGGGDDA